jgi:hypothetical protein
MAETSISGAEVPKPTSTIPIINGDMPRYRATPTAPSTNRSALHTRSINPRTIDRNAGVIFYTICSIKKANFELKTTLK